MILAAILIAVVALIVFHFKRSPVVLKSRLRNTKVEIYAHRRRGRRWPVGLGASGGYDQPLPNTSAYVLSYVYSSDEDADDRLLHAVVESKQRLRDAVKGNTKEQELHAAARKALKR